MNEDYEPKYNDANIDKIPEDIYNLKPNYNLSINDKINIFNEMDEANIPICRYTVNKLYKAYHLETEKEGKFDNAIRNYNYLFKDKINIDKEELKNVIDELTEGFRKSPKFHGRVPGIIEDLAISYMLIAKNRPIKIEDMVTNFNVRVVGDMVQAHLPKSVIALSYLHFDDVTCAKLAKNPEKAFYIGDLLYSAYIENNNEKDFIKKTDAANWLAEHLDSSEDLFESIKKDYDYYNLNSSVTVSNVKAQADGLAALPLVKQIEKRYKKPGFKFENVTCELKGVAEVINNNSYSAYIMEPTDPRQVVLGEITYCCQKLNDAGESAMMHGLLNPRAGFFIIEDRYTKEIKVQAEAWEKNADTLVFDNLEFANDADFKLYTAILAKWLQNTEYKTVIMGKGYNQLAYTNTFYPHGGITPPVTPYEIFVISYEEGSEAPIFESEEEAKKALESGEVTYYDYVYCDSENESYYLKRDGELSKGILSNKDIYVNALVAYVGNNIPKKLQDDIINLNSNFIIYNTDYDKKLIIDFLKDYTNNFKSKPGRPSISEIEKFINDNNLELTGAYGVEFKEAVLASYDYYDDPSDIELFAYYPALDRYYDGIDNDYENDYEEEYDEDDEYDDEYNDEY